MSNAAGAHLRDLKRRKAFDTSILPARKVARSRAERVQAVSFSVVFHWIDTLLAEAEKKCFLKM